VSKGVKIMGEGLQLKLVAGIQSSKFSRYIKDNLHAPSLANIVRQLNLPAILACFSFI
jgi:hypothetical protein